MPEITQKLGFDTSGAVSSIAAMDAALRGLNTRLRAFNKAADGGNSSKVVTGFSQVGSAAKKAGEAVGQFGTKTKASAAKAASSVQKVTFAFSGLAKALVARTAVQAITVMTGAITESANAAADFEIAIARISNIAQGPGSSINELTTSLADLAVELGRPQTEVASAAWEALQNDLGSTAETMNLLKGAANDLALVTGGTLTQAVNSLSSVLKAYDLDISKANEVSDQFFAAIDKGRISLAELESSLGKITPLAAKLDIGFKEVAAAMAAITQSGTSASVANTQLRSIFQKLIRPTDELQGAFEKLGAQTFNELIANMGGLQPALEGIADALDRDDRAIAKAFGRLRGQLGVFNLLAHEGKIFSDTLEAVENSAGSAAEAADNIDGTAARESQKAWAQFDETMRQVGVTVLEVQTKFITAFNAIAPGGRTVIVILEQLAAAVITLGATAAVVWTLNTAFAALGVTAGAAGATLTLAFAPFLAAAATGAAIGAALVGIKAAFVTSADEMVAKSKQAISQIEESHKSEIKQNSQEIKDLLGERGHLVDEYIKGLAESFDEETKVLNRAASTIGGALQSTVERFGSSMDAVFKRVQSKIDGIADSLKSARNELASAEKGLSDFEFDTAQDKKKKPLDKAESALKRARDKAKELDGVLKAVDVNPDLADAAIDRIKELIEYAKDAKREAANIDPKKDPANKAKKEQIIEAATKQERVARQLLVVIKELELSKVEALAASANAAQAELDTQQLITAQIQEQITLLAQKVAAQGSDTGAKTEDEKQKVQTEIDRIRKTISDLSGNLGGDLFKQMGESANVQILIKALKDGFAKAQYDFGNLRNQIDAKLNEAEFKVHLNAVLNRPDTGNEEVSGRLDAAVEEGGGNVVKQAENIRNEAAKILNESGEAVLKVKSLNQTISEKQKLVDKSAGRIADLMKRFPEMADTMVGKMSTRLQAMQEQLLDPATTAKQLDAIALQVDAWITELDGKEIKGIKVEEWTAALNAIGEQVPLLKEKLSLAGQALNPDQAKQLATYIREASTASGEYADAVGEAEVSVQAVVDNSDLIALYMGNASVKAKETAENVGLIPSPAHIAKTAIAGIKTVVLGVTSATKGAISAMNALKAAALAALAAAKAANAEAAKGGSKYHGGKVNYRATGGPTRGQDTLMTATAPGEFITSAKNTRKFYSQLQAMNAGQTPQYRDKGGPVTNIGDINVSVSDKTSASPTTVGRSIASELRRELRRQTSTF